MGSRLTGIPKKESQKGAEAEGSRLSRPLAAAALAAIAALAAPPRAAAATCIVSGDPEAVASAGSHASASEGTALVTGTLSSPGGVAALEARYRTRDASLGVALRTDAFTGTLIYLR